VLFSSVDDAGDYLGSTPVHTRRIIGIAGEPGAGKSTIAEMLAARLSAALLPMDGYHLPQSRLVELGRRDRMGAPDTFDVDAFVLTLADLRLSSSTVRAPSFDREIEEAVSGAIEIPPEVETAIVEGNYLLLDSGGWERVAALLDVVFFVDVDHDIRMLRLINRHVRFGKTQDAARAWALGPDESNAALVRATAPRADHVIRLT
jgi:pantothenate kinase